MGPSLSVIIPVGPGHGELSKRAAVSVNNAWHFDRGPFRQLRVTRIDDRYGRLGRSAARNKGMDENPADWFFLLDADDRMMRDALTLVRFDAAATFGAIVLDGRPHRHDRHPVYREDLFYHGAQGTLSMGCFVRGDLGLRFDESLDNGEDFDFYMRLPDFVKIREPLVDIGYRYSSAGGPRSSNEPWGDACKRVIDKYRRRESGSAAPAPS